MQTNKGVNMHTNSMNNDANSNRPLLDGSKGVLFTTSKMRHTRTIGFFGGLILALTGAVAQASGIYFETPTTITGNSTDILTLGTPCYAYAWNGAAGTVTINGVSFTGTTTVNSTIDGNLSLTHGSYYGGDNQMSMASARLSADYKKLVGGVAYYDITPNHPETVTLRNLTIGHSYALQIWVNDSRFLSGGKTTRGTTVSSLAGRSVYLDFNDTDALGGVGQFTVGRFFATSATEVFTISGGDQYLNALQLRDITALGYWTGLAGGTLNATSDSFSTNRFDAPLATGNLAAAEGNVTFADSYFANGTAIPVTQTNITVVTAGVAANCFFFYNNAVNYLLSSADANGICGKSILVKSGAATLTLAGSNTYTGVTIVDGGTLTINGSLANANITINNGAVNGNGTLNYRLAGANTDSIDVNSGGAINISNLALNVVINGTIDVNEYVIVNDQSKVTGTFAAVNSPNQYWSVDYDGTTAHPNAVVLVFDAASAQVAWDGSTDGSWIVGQNWAGDATPINGVPLLFPASAANKANTNNLLNSVMSMKLEGGYTVSGNPLTLYRSVESAGNNSIALPMTLGGPCKFDVTADTLTLSAALSGAGGVIKNGAGALAVSSGNTYAGATTINSGTLKLLKPIADNPLPMTGNLVARWDASAITGVSDGAQLDTWTDSSGKNRTATRAAGTPKYVQSGANGVPVVRFDTDGNSYYNFPELATIRSVFYVALESRIGNMVNFILGHNNKDTYHFCRGDNDLIWHATYAHDNIKNGVTRLNGINVDGRTTPFGANALKLLSVVTTGNVAANRISQDRNIVGRSWGGDIGEILIYDTELTDAERLLVEQYLINKWRLTSLTFANVLPPATPVALPNASSTLDMNGVSQSIGSLSGVAGSQLLLNGGVLAVGNNNASTTFSGTIVDGTTTGGCLVKDGTGDLCLAGEGANTFTGDTILRQGMLGLAKTGGTAVGGNFVGTCNNPNPTLYTLKDNQFALGAVISCIGDADYVCFDLLGTTQTLAGISDSTGRCVIQTKQWSTQPLVDSLSTLILNGAGAYSFNGHLRNRGGQMELVKNGTGTQTFLGSDVGYTGSTTINGGTLQVGNGTSDGSVASPSIVNNSILVYNLAVGSTYSGVISGSGILTKKGAGILTLNNANTYTGATTVEAGTLKGAIVGALPVATDFVLSSGAKLDLTTINQTVKTLTLNGTLIKRGNCTWGATGSGATYINDDYFKGTGQLTVLGPPTPGTIIVIR